MNGSLIGGVALQRKAAIAFWAILLAAIVCGTCFAADKREPLVVVQNGKYGYINHDGKILIRPQFIWAGDFQQGLGTAYICGRYVSIDSSGTLLPLRIAVPGKLEPEKKGDKFGFVDASGKFKIAPAFDEVLPFSGGSAAVRMGEKCGFIDTAGRQVIPPQFKAAYYFREGVATAELDSGSVLIDTTGEVIAQGFRFVLGVVAYGRVPASRGDKGGYLDLRGNVAISFVYDSVRTFSEGFAAVEKEGKWGYIDRSGKLVIPHMFDEEGPFANGLAPAKTGKTSGFINRSGGFVFYLAFEHAPGFLAYDDENMFLAPSDVSRFWTADDKFGYVNTSGQVIWGPVAGSPDHRPLCGWSDEDKIRSCEGVPGRIRDSISKFPE